MSACPFDQPPAPSADRQLFHASCVAHRGRAVLICGASGAGKSSLALRMIALGAGLVSDDGTLVEKGPGGLIARCPSLSIQGLIEARGIGLLHSPYVGPMPLDVVVDLDQLETQRLPLARKVTLLDVTLPLVLRPQTPHLAEAMMLWLQSGRSEA